MDGAIYEYNNELYTWDGTDLVKSNEQIELQIVSLMITWILFLNQYHI